MPHLKKGSPDKWVEADAQKARAVHPKRYVFKTEP